MSPESVGIHARLCCAISSPVTTAITPGNACAFERVDPVDRWRARTGSAGSPCAASREVDVVDVVAGAADEPVVLDALDAVADPADLFGLGRHVVWLLPLGGDGLTGGGVLRLDVVAAAAWIAFTMFM